MPVTSLGWVFMTCCAASVVPTSQAMPFRRRGTGPKSNYITRQGFERMKAEAENLWNVERPRVTQEVVADNRRVDRTRHQRHLIFVIVVRLVGPEAHEKAH